MAAAPTLVVIAKEPVAGRVKTRLIPHLGAAGAAYLAGAALADTLDAVARAPAARRVLVLDGEPGDWVPAGFDVVPQVEGGLDLRLAAAFAGCTGPTVLVGMDTPQLRPEQLAVCFEAADAWLGPADDGGYWLIGMRDPDPTVFPGVPMSSHRTGRVQAARLRQSGRRVGRADTMTDVDTYRDAVAVAALAPNGRFAAALRELSTGSAWARSTPVYETALDAGSALRLVASDGQVIALDVARWQGGPDAADQSLVDRCVGSTLDVGCGPGRLAAAIAARGGRALGIDVAAGAVRLARRAGATALCRDVFDPVPAEGRWDTVLLADGNLGIDGEPSRLLARVRDLLRPGGTLLVEPHPQDVDELVTVQLCDGTSARSEPFVWAHLGPAAATWRVEAAGYRLAESWSVAGRPFLSFRS
jgi:glycosyltransferase A (GT-A) superfamily protein (DUF2064 family)